MHMAMVWTTLCTYLATHRSISRYVASLLALKFRSSRREQIAALITRSSLFACTNNGFRSSARWPSPRAFGPAVELESPSPSSLGARCLLAQTTAFARCRDSSFNSVVHTIVICKGSNIKSPATRSTSQKYQSIVTQKIQQKFLHIGKWSRTPKYYTTQWFPKYNLCC